MWLVVVSGLGRSTDSLYLSPSSISFHTNYLFRPSSSFRPGDDSVTAVPLTDDEVEAYMRGVAWCMRMYLTGEAPDEGFRYLAKSAPTPGQCLVWLKAYEARHAEQAQYAGMELVITAPTSDSSPLSVDETLLLLMPQWGREMLPERLRPALDAEELKWWYPEPCAVCETHRTALTKLIKERQAESKKPGADLKAVAAAFRPAVRSADLAYQRHRAEAHPEETREPIPAIQQWMASKGMTAAGSLGGNGSSSSEDAYGTMDPSFEGGGGGAGGGGLDQDEALAAAVAAATDERRAEQRARTRQRAAVREEYKAAKEKHKATKEKQLKQAQKKQGSAKAGRADDRRGAGGAGAGAGARGGQAASSSNQRRRRRSPATQAQGATPGKVRVVKQQQQQPPDQGGQQAQERRASAAAAQP